MVHAIKERVTVGAGGVIALRRPELREGATAEVIVLIEDAAVPVADGVPDVTGPFDRSNGSSRPLVSFLGACRGQFGAAEEADAHLRELRDEWERP